MSQQPLRLNGFHHLTAVSANISGNHAFYTGALGLRLVKKSVNQDDVSAYHLFYADGAASPGTDLTFFDFAMPPERRGTRSITRTSLRVANASSLEWWQRRLSDLKIEHNSIAPRDGRPTLDFSDAEGQRLALVLDDAGGESHPWADSPVPAEHQLRGLGPIELSVPALEPTQRLLLDLLSMQHASEFSRDDGTAIHVFKTTPHAGPAGTLHIAIEPDAPRARQGAGAVHHVAFRTTLDEYPAWLRRLNEAGITNSGPVDRFYFRSLYFREPSGILFEIATDEPGFTADEPLEALGKKLALPPFLEPQRAAIEAGLKPIA